MINILIFLNTKTENLVQVQYASNQFLSNIINSGCGVESAALCAHLIVGGRTSVALHQVLKAGVKRGVGSMGEIGGCLNSLRLV